MTTGEAIEWHRGREKHSRRLVSDEWRDPAVREVAQMEADQHAAIAVLLERHKELLADWLEAYDDGEDCKTSFDKRDWLKRLTVAYEGAVVKQTRAAIGG